MQLEKKKKDKKILLNQQNNDGKSSTTASNDHQHAWWLKNFNTNNIKYGRETKKNYQCTNDSPKIECSSVCLSRNCVDQLLSIDIMSDHFPKLNVSDSSATILHCVVLFHNNNFIFALSRTYNSNRFSYRPSIYSDATHTYI